MADVGDVDQGLPGGECCCGGGGRVYVVDGGGFRGEVAGGGGEMGGVSTVVDLGEGLVAGAEAGDVRAGLFGDAAAPSTVAEGGLFSPSPLLPAALSISQENCSSCTRTWWAAQDWIPTATVRAEDDGAVLAMVGSGLGMAIMPVLSLTGAPPGLEIADLGPDRPTRQVGYVTTPELAACAAVRALVRALRSYAKPQVSAV